MLNKRLNYIDQAKAIGILLIVLGHISYIWGDLSYFASYFKISIFYIISGFIASLNSNTINLNLKAKSLLIPYFFYSLLFFITRIVKGVISSTTLESLGIILIDVLSLRGISTLWFLPSFSIEYGLYCILLTLLKGMVAYWFFEISYLFFRKRLYLKRKRLL